MRRGSINPEGMFCYIDLLSCFKVKDSFVTKLSNKLSFIKPSLIVEPSFIRWLGNQNNWSTFFFYLGGEKEYKRLKKLIKKQTSRVIDYKEDYNIKRFNTYNELDQHLKTYNCEVILSYNSSYMTFKDTYEPFWNKNPDSVALINSRY